MSKAWTAPDWSPSRLGLAGTDPETLRGEVLACWDEFISAAKASDLSAPSRLPRWTGRDVCIHLGAWPDHDTLRAVAESARAGDVGRTTPADDANARLVRSHRDASDAEVIGALEQARSDVDDFFGSGLAAELGTSWAGSPVGPLPSLTLVHAGCYELAVHTIDLAPNGAPEPSDGLVRQGIAALIDVTGALSAQHGIRAEVTARTPDYGWRFDCDPRTGWSTTATGPDARGGAVIEGTALDVLDASAGRMNVATALVRGRLKVHGLPAMLRLAPLLDAVPGLPGGAVLRHAAARLAGAGKLLGRIRGLG